MLSEWLQSEVNKTKLKKSIPVACVDGNEVVDAIAVAFVLAESTRMGHNGTFEQQMVVKSVPGTVANAALAVVLLQGDLCTTMELICVDRLNTSSQSAVHGESVNLDNLNLDNCEFHEIKIKVVEQKGS